MAVSLKVNGTEQRVDVDPETPLLWVLRDTLGLTGTKFGCGIAACGACTVHVDGAAIRSCVTPVEVVEGAEVTTIEGLSPDRGHRVRRQRHHPALGGHPARGAAHLGRPRAARQRTPGWLHRVRPRGTAAPVRRLLRPL